MIYQVKKDITLLDQTIKKNSIIRFDSSDIFEYKHLDGSSSTLRKGYVESNKDLFEPLEIKEQEISDSEDVKRYRIQLDINCKYSDLSKIKEMIELQINEFF